MQSLNFTASKRGATAYRQPVSGIALSPVTDGEVKREASEGDVQNRLRVHMALESWHGARWWKCDFHTHTPASRDYGKGPSHSKLRKRMPREWLLDYMRAGVDCVAVTDHNSGAWIDDLKEALAQLATEQPEGYRQLYLFPGVEIAVNGGVHLLAILPIEKNRSDITRLLGVVGFETGSSQLTTLTLEKVAQKIQAVGGIAIPAHVDKEKGLFSKLFGQSLQSVLSCKYIFAMEVVEPRFEKPGAYNATSPQWTEILGSDSHHPSGNPGERFPGSHFTWVKMGTPDLDGLRLALLDGPVSVCRSDSDFATPNVHATLILECIEITGAKYMGRGIPFVAGLNPWFNAIIGGRGTGKSSLIEFLRVALCRLDELPRELASDFKMYSEIYRSRADSGLLTADAVIRVIYSKNGSRFRVQWSHAGNLNPIQEEDSGTWSVAQGEVNQRFPIRMYSQKQIFFLASSPAALLRIVDDAPELEQQAWSERRRLEEHRCLSFRVKIRELEAELEGEKRLRGELDDVKRKLTLFENAGHADLLKSFQRHQRQGQKIKEWELQWADASERLRQTGADFVPETIDDIYIDAASQKDESLLAHAADVRARLKEIRQQLELFAEEVEGLFSHWRVNLEQSECMQAARASADAYDTLKKQLEKEEVNDPGLYGQIVQRRQDIEGRLAAMRNREKEAEKLKKQAACSLKRLVEIRRDMTKARRYFFADVLKNNPYVRIKVIPYGGSEADETEFRRLIQRDDERFEKDIGRANGILGRIFESRGNTAAAEKVLAQEKQRIRDIITGDHTPSDRRFAAHLGRLTPEALDRLDIWFPEDSLDVQYSPKGDGAHFRSISEGSPGQKTAALLAFLLSYGDEPLVLDQPEDDLDNKLIHELIVKQIRDAKQRRQIIVVTHNPNIVVNGDAELVVALAAQNGETQIECQGSLQNGKVRTTICEIMEGGRDAFAERYRRINVDVLNA